MPSYYDDEEDPNALGTDTEEDYLPASFPTANQVSMDRALSAQLPGSAMLPIGNATREFATGRPGLFVQGGPTIPAGMIEVNGQLERSQAAPQPVPWWITARDEALHQQAEEQRQQNFLRSLVAQAGPAGAQAINRAQQLQARIQLNSDIKSGMPFRDALIKNAANLYANAPAAMTRLATARPAVVKPPFAPTQTVLGGKTYTQVSPNRFVRESEAKGLTPAQELSYLGQQSKIVAKQLEDATTSNDTAAIASAKMELQSLKDQADELRGKKVAKAQQTQTSPRLAKANQLATELKQSHPDWSDDKIKQTVIDTIKGLK